MAFLDSFIKKTKGITNTLSTFANAGQDALNSIIPKNVNVPKP